MIKVVSSIMLLAVAACSAPRDDTSKDVIIDPEKHRAAFNECMEFYPDPSAHDHSRCDEQATKYATTGPKDSTQQAELTIE